MGTVPFLWFLYGRAPWQGEAPPLLDSPILLHCGTDDNVMVYSYASPSTEMMINAASSHNVDAHSQDQARTERWRSMKTSV